MDNQSLDFVAGRSGGLSKMIEHYTTLEKMEFPWSRSESPVVFVRVSGSSGRNWIPTGICNWAINGCSDWLTTYNKSWVRRILATGNRIKTKPGIGHVCLLQVVDVAVSTPDTASFWLVSSKCCTLKRTHRSVLCGMVKKWSVVHGRKRVKTSIDCLCGW
jgi:hypothetical protein